MRPQKVRHLLSEYGEVGRVYLAAEDAAVRRGKRQSATNAVNSSSSQNNNKKKLAARAPKRFTEGWVEFEDKEDAKRVAAALNGQPVGGRPRSNHRHDLWCLKYLKGFKWDDLTEEVAAQNAARESRLAAEASAAARERDFYLSRVDEARGREAVRKRREAKAERERELCGATDYIDRAQLKQQLALLGATRQRLAEWLGELPLGAQGRAQGGAQGAAFRLLSLLLPLLLPSLLPLRLRRGVGLSGRTASSEEGTKAEEEERRRARQRQRGGRRRPLGVGAAAAAAVV